MTKILRGATAQSAMAKAEKAIPTIAISQDDLEFIALQIAGLKSWDEYHHKDWRGRVKMVDVKKVYRAKAVKLFDNLKRNQDLRLLKNKKKR